VSIAATMDDFIDSLELQTGDYQPTACPSLR
jgi:hypothetical protein